MIISLTISISRKKRDFVIEELIKLDEFKLIDVARKIGEWTMQLKGGASYKVSGTIKDYTDLSSHMLRIEKRIGSSYTDRINKFKKG